MEYTIDPARGVPSCGYIENIEFARRPAGTPGVQRTVLEQPLYMQLLRPLGPSVQEKAPIVVFVVGGGFRRPQVCFRVPWMARLAERGFVVAMPEYRTGEGAGYPEMVRDIRDAVRYMRQNGARYGGDPDRIVLMGGSAGGYLALMAAYDTAGEFDGPQDAGPTADVRGVIDMYGMVEPVRTLPEGYGGDAFANSAHARMVGDHAIGTGLNKLESAAVTRRIAPQRPLPPTLILHGTADTLIPLDQSRLLYTALRQAGQAAELCIVQGAGHADPVFFEEELMARYDAFIRRVTGG